MESGSVDTGATDAGFGGDIARTTDTGAQRSVTRATDSWRKGLGVDR